MTATKARLTAPAAGLLRAVSGRYGGELTFVRALAGGWANDVFLLEAPSGPVVLRLKHPPSDVESIAWEHRVVAQLACAVREVVAPVRAVDGSTFFLHAGDAVSLVPFVHGIPADRGSEAHRKAAGDLLGRLHAASVRLRPGPRRGVDALQQLRELGVAELPAAWQPRVDALRRDALRLVDRVERSHLCRGVIHGDFFPGNVLFRDDDVVGLVDWEEAHSAPLVFELANAAWEFTKCKDTDDFDREAAVRFIGAYRQAGGPVPLLEDELIVPLIRAKRTLELLRAPGDRHVDWDYQEHNLRSAERLR
jgi:Ser/Thr protein kinase RdoA (MazF antagonist)